jgi:integrase
MLQNRPQISYRTPNQGGEFMGGSVQYHKPAKRWYIDIYWKGKHHKLWKDYDSFQPFITKTRALKYLGILQKQIEDHDFDPRYWKPDSPVSVRKYAMGWLDEKEVDYRTWRDYKTDVTKYIIPYFKSKDIRHLKAKDLKNFMKWLNKKGLAPDTVTHKMSTLKTMLKDAYRDEDIKRVPPFPVLKRKTLTRPDSLTIEQQDTLINAIPERHRPIFEFGMALGLRVGEVRAIQKDCLRDGKVYIERAFSDNRLKGTKTGLERSYELTEYEQDILTRVKFNLSPFVFTRDDGKPYTNKNLNHIWDPACKKTDIKIKLQNAMRHSLGCQLVDAGHDLDLVREQLGHTDIRTTKRYARRSDRTLTEARESGRKVLPFSGRIVDEK